MLQNKAILKDLISIQKLEKEKTLSPQILSYLYENKLLKIFAPDSLGGLGASLEEGLKLFQETAAIDGNIGWAVTIGSGGNMFFPSFSQEISKARFSSKEALIAGSGMATGVAKKVEGGYQISGTWKYCSGADYATLFTMVCILEDSEDMLTCSVKPKDVKIIKDWQAFGLKATASHTIQVENAFIKEGDTFEISSIQNTFDLPVHTFPFFTFAESSFFAVALGMAEKVLEEQEIVLHQKFNKQTEHYKFIKEQLGNASVHLFKIEKEFYTHVSTLWSQHIQQVALKDEQLRSFTEFCKQKMDQLVQVIHKIMRYFGMTGILETSPLNYAWRNFCTASQHAMLMPL